MESIVDDLAQRIRALNREQKDQLLRAVLIDLDGAMDPDAERAWIDLAMRRRREIEEGKVTPVPADDAYARVRSRLHR